MSLLLLYILVTLPALAGRALAIRCFGVDEGEAWALGRTFGLVLVAYPAWWVGVAGVAAWQAVGAALLVGAAVVGGVDLWRRSPDWRALGRAELVFIVAASVVVWLRLARPDILHQEKLMDLGIFASLLRADGFPPPDMWLAGEALPYYYWGAVPWTVPLWLGRLPLDLAYNLVVAAIAGLSGCLFWALGRRAGGTEVSGWMAVGFGLFAGTADGFRQFVSGVSIASLDLWASSRQVPDTITEWPLFTLWLGDLHPHLLSIPLALATVLLAWRIGAAGPKWQTVIAVSVLLGVTWAANPWAMPPTLVAAALMILCGDGRWHWPGASGWHRWAALPLIAVGGWLLTAPFHLSFHPPFQGIGLVHAWTHPAYLLLWGGVLLVPAVVIAGSGLVRMLGGGEKGIAVAVTLLAGTMILASQTGRPTLVLLALLLAVLVTVAVTGGEWAFRPSVALAALGVFLLAVPEVLFVVDSYGDKLHRMNTVFKCYIQAWLLLAIAMPGLLAAGLRRSPARVWLTGALIVLSLPHLIGMAIQPLLGRAQGLDGLAWMDPADRAIVRFLRDQPHGTTIIEAVGGAYSEYARISSASGVPALLGWANHEMVWRGHGINDETERRRRLVNTVYRSDETREVAEAVERAGVDFVIIGALEIRDFQPVHLEVLRSAGSIVFDENGGQVIAFGDRRAGPEAPSAEEGAG